MDIQHLLYARDEAKAKGFALATPVPHDDGFECSLVKDDLAVFTAIRQTDNLAIQACIDHLQELPPAHG